LRHTVISRLFSFAKFEINESCRRKLRFKDNALRNKKAGVLEYVYGGLAIVDAAITGREKDFSPPRSSAPCVRCYRWKQVENPSALILEAFIPSCATRSHARPFFSSRIFFITCPRECVVGTRKYCRPLFESHALAALDIVDRSGESFSFRDRRRLIDITIIDHSRKASCFLT